MQKRKLNMLPIYTIHYQHDYLEQLFQLKELEPYSFGMEWFITKEVVHHFICTPPIIRLDKQVNKITLNNEKITAYEVFLERPNIFPLYTPKNASISLYLRHIKQVLNPDEEIYVQMLIQKNHTWKYQAINQYESYLKGNDNPANSKHIIKLQEKLIQTLNKISNHEIIRKPIPQVEEKILDHAYTFQMRVLINAAKKRTKVIIQTLKEILKIYNGYNQLTIQPIHTKSYIKHFLQRKITATNILSLTELNAFIGIQQEKQSTVTHYKTTNTSIQAHLPTIQHDLEEIDQTYLTKMKHALQRLDLADRQSLEMDIQTGVRLIKITLQLPKNKKFTDYEKQLKNIQAVLGVDSLSIVQGEQANTVAFLLPNPKPSIIPLGNLIDNPSFQKYTNQHPLSFIVGVNEINQPIYASLQALRHLLVAGTNGSGKSEFIKSIITTFLLQYHPSELILYLIDPKQVEFTFFESFPHVVEVVTDTEKAYQVYQTLVFEMENRYRLMKEKGVNHIDTYNERAKKKIPYIVCAIDEYADLVMQKPEVEDLIIRLGQKARASGIHLIISTQRPSKDIISSKLTANLQNAVSFNLGNNTNYRTVFGTGIPYSNLLGKGDGVFKFENYPKEFQRFQSPIVCPNQSNEQQLFQNLAKRYEGVEKSILNLSKEENELDKLKSIIATTGETRLTALREQMQMSNTKLSELMDELIQEGWLIKHKSKAKGYELIASEEEIQTYKKNENVL